MKTRKVELHCMRSFVFFFYSLKGGEVTLFDKTVKKLFNMSYKYMFLFSSVNKKKLKFAHQRIFMH